MHRCLPLFVLLTLFPLVHCDTWSTLYPKILRDPYDLVQSGSNYLLVGTESTSRTTDWKTFNQSYFGQQQFWAPSALPNGGFVVFAVDMSTSWVSTNGEDWTNTTLPQWGHFLSIQTGYFQGKLFVLLAGPYDGSKLAQCHSTVDGIHFMPCGKFSTHSDSLRLVAHGDELVAFELNNGDNWSYNSNDNNWKLGQQLKYGRISRIVAGATAGKYIIEYTPPPPRNLTSRLMQIDLVGDKKPIPLPTTETPTSICCFPESSNYFAHKCVVGLQAHWSPHADNPVLHWYQFDPDMKFPQFTKLWTTNNYWYSARCTSDRLVLVPQEYANGAAHVLYTPAGSLRSVNRTHGLISYGTVVATPSGFVAPAGGEKSAGETGSPALKSQTSKGLHWDQFIIPGTEPALKAMWGGYSWNQQTSYGADVTFYGQWNRTIYATKDFNKVVLHQLDDAVFGASGTVTNVVQEGNKILMLFQNHTMWAIAMTKAPLTPTSAFQITYAIEKSTHIFSTVDGLVTTTIDGVAMYMLGGWRHLMYSTDGTSWKNITVPGINSTSLVVRGMAAVDGHLFVMIQKLRSIPQLYEVSSSGKPTVVKKYTHQLQPLSEWSNAVQPLPALNAIIVPLSSSRYIAEISQDYGKTWSLLSQPATNFNDLCPSTFSANPQATLVAMMRCGYPNVDYMFHMDLIE